MFFMGILTISMAIFNSYVAVITRPGKNMENPNQIFAINKSIQCWHVKKSLLFDILYLVGPIYSWFTY